MGRILIKKVNKHWSFPLRPTINFEHFYSYIDHVIFLEGRDGRDGLTGPSGPPGTPGLQGGLNLKYFKRALNKSFGLLVVSGSFGLF